jgi:integrase
MSTRSRSLELQTVFEDWVASRPGRGPRAGNGALADTSARLYRDMWAVFSQFLLSRPKRRSVDASGLTAVRSSDLRDFVDAAQPPPGTGNPWSARYAWRMLHLIDRVLRFQLLRCGLRPGPHTAAAELLRETSFRFANASHLDGEPRPLRVREAQRVQRHLEGELKASLSLDPTGRQWKAVRDAAAAAVMLGAGLAPGDVQSLPLDSIRLGSRRRVSSAWLRVPADGLSPEHEAPLAEWAVPLLKRWLVVRRRRGIDGPWAFPSTSKGSPLSRMSCHRCVVRVLDAAGVPGGVPFRLRHTCAVAWLRAGHGDETVGQWLGLVERKALRRYATLARRGQRA